MFRIKLRKRVNRSFTPKTRLSVADALTLVCVESDADRGYYRPLSSQTRVGLVNRAIGKKNTAPAGSPRAVGTNPRLIQNDKHVKSLPKYVEGTYAG